MYHNKKERMLCVCVCVQSIMCLSVTEVLVLVCQKLH
ncbi:hypothetical protein GBAR_LOCUS12702 [Geodia barretti]|uniref:Uncharacterized protein n=1 Tax=Geodia barretti TaxID=519541 RepID=A0AA35WHC4_GEOBA|nr:hypothetical protein GBAR_LOCUS12702 [Geodia barretti]